VAAAFTLLAILSGAWVTSTRAVSGAPAGIEKIHLGVTAVATALVVALSLWLVLAKLRGLGWALLAVCVAQGALGQMSAAIAHAVLAQILFALAVAVVIRTSKRWEAGPDLVFDQGWPSLRSMAVATPVVVLTQVMLGVAFRHKAAGLTWHIVGAMVTALMVLILGMCVMQAYPKHRVLRPAAIALLCAALVQVLLGIATITVEMLAPDNAVPASVVFSAMAHVAVGAVTLAASLALAIQVRRNVHRPVEEEAERAAGA
jgi:heme A synthase